MSTVAQEIVQVCEALPVEKQAEVADFARFLLAQQDDQAWERSLSSTQRRPRLEAFLRDATIEGDEPLDLKKL